METQKDTSQFYKNLPAFKEFSQLTDSDKFVDIPDSWNIVISDVKGSTQAVREGRYKDVNLIGAATITCAMNLSNEGEIPFVFGGDGATLLVPDKLLSPLCSELQRLQKLALTRFQLSLRVGYVSMKALRNAGLNLQVAKYELSPGNFTAQFKGGALLVAEEMIKKGFPLGATTLEPTSDKQTPQLEGLSCRLSPLKNQNGIILSILAKPVQGQNEETLNEILTGLKQILKGDFLSARPVSKNRLSWKWPPRTLFSEVKIQSHENSSIIQFIICSLKSLALAVLLTFNLPLGNFRPKTYKEELILNSDYKKFDETLRMVIDCSLEQATEIEEFLLQLKNKNKIIYGIHRSKSALMTCMVKSATNHQHIHFIDGAEGGYTLAAAQMKEQLTTNH